MGKMMILDVTGDSVVEWNLDDVAAIQRAEATFRDQLLARQMAFDRPENATAEEAERIYAFDPGAEEIIWVRPIQGG
jgi:hypothetical protein